MPISVEQLSFIRQRADHKCEYCGVTEIDTGGMLTIDHFQPVCVKGTDDLDNLVYACFRCNIYKSDFWPIEPSIAPIWNPRSNEQLSEHYFEMEDGRLLAQTETGRMTIEVLRLNRRPLVESRLRTHRIRIHSSQVSRLVEITNQLSRLKSELATSSIEETRLLSEQHQILDFLRKHYS